MVFLSQQQLMKNAEALLRESRVIVDTLRERLGIDKTDNLSTLYGAMVIDDAYYHELCELYDIAEVYNLCKSQEMVTRDGTNTVVLIGYELLQQVFKEGISPKVICKILPKAAEKAIDILTSMAVPVDVRKDRKYLLQSTITAIGNRVDPRNKVRLAEIAVGAASLVADPVRDIWCTYDYMGGKVDETRFMEGCPFHRVFGVPRSESSSSSSITIAFIDADILPTDLQAHGADPIADEVTVYALALINLLNGFGVNLVVIDCIRLRDSATRYAYKLLVDRGGIHVVDYTHGRVSVDFICKALNCRPIVTTDDFADPSNFGHADGIEDVMLGGGHADGIEDVMLGGGHDDGIEDVMLGGISYVQITGIKWNMDRGRTSTIILRGSQAEYYDMLSQPYVLKIALANLATLFKHPFLIPGGGAPHIQLSIALSEFVEEKEKEIGTDNRMMEQMKCTKLFAKALEVIPWTLARNVGLDPATTVTELKDDHKLGLINAGINTSEGHTSTDMLKEGVVHPLLLLTSAIRLATKFVCRQCKPRED